MRLLARLFSLTFASCVSVEDRPDLWCRILGKLDVKPEEFVNSHITELVKLFTEDHQPSEVSCSVCCAWNYSGSLVYSVVMQGIMK